MDRKKFKQFLCLKVRKKKFKFNLKIKKHA